MGYGILSAADPHSAEMAPRRPVLKLSMLRTVLASRGTAVPPAVMHTTGRPDSRFSTRNASRASLVCASSACGVCVCA